MGECRGLEELLVKLYGNNSLCSLFHFSQKSLPLLDADDYEDYDDNDGGSEAASTVIYGVNGRRSRSRSGSRSDPTPSPTYDVVNTSDVSTPYVSTPELTSSPEAIDFRDSPVRRRL